MSVPLEYYYFSHKGGHEYFKVTEMVEILYWLLRLDSGGGGWLQAFGKQIS